MMYLGVLGGVVQSPCQTVQLRRVAGFLPRIGSAGWISIAPSPDLGHIQ